MKTQKHRKSYTIHASTLTVSWFVFYKQCATALLILKTLSNAQNPEFCLYTAQQTAKIFPGCNWLPNTLASPNPLFTFHKRKDWKWPTE